MEALVAKGKVRSIGILRLPKPVLILLRRFQLECISIETTLEDRQNSSCSKSNRDPPVIHPYTINTDSDGLFNLNYTSSAKNTISS